VTNEERSKTRAEELVASADTSKVLYDVDALDLFKKTCQVQVLVCADWAQKIDCQSPPSSRI